jgi:AraC-like DNA-binding protein
MKIRPSVSFNYGAASNAGVSPAVERVCCYPLKAGRISNAINGARWAIEYHSKYAGLMRLKKYPDGWIKREEKTVHIYAPGCEYVENTLDADLPIQETYIIFRDETLPVLADMVGLDGFAKIYVEDDSMQELFLNAVKFCDAYGEKGFWKVQTALMEIIHLLSMARKESGFSWRISGESTQGAELFSEKVDKYLRKNIDRNLKSSDIASFMKVSESTLNHKYKEEAGLAPISRFIEMRIDFAKSLLMKGETLKIIAEMTGYYDEYHLSKAFKKTVGLSPREYRQSVSQPSN